MVKIVKMLKIKKNKDIKIMAVHHLVINKVSILITSTSILKTLTNISSFIHSNQFLTSIVVTHTKKKKKKN